MLLLESLLHAVQLFFELLDLPLIPQHLLVELLLGRSGPRGAREELLRVDVSDLERLRLSGSSHEEERQRWEREPDAAHILIGVAS